MVIATTDRLVIREANFKDADFILQLINEPAWHKYIGAHNVSTRDLAQEFIAEKLVNSYQKFGHGLWLVELKENQKPIGICGLVNRDFLSTIDLGFAFLTEFQGLGYARESSLSSLDYAKSVLNAKRIAAITKSDNKASIGLLKNLGFEYQEDVTRPDSNEVLALYEMDL